MPLFGSAFVTVAVQYDARSDAPPPPLCRVVMPFYPVNLKECKQTVFLSSEPLEHPLAMPVCLFFEPVDEGKNAPAHLFLCCKRLYPSRSCIDARVYKNAPECSCMFFIFGAWGVILNCFLDVADVVYMAFLMHSSGMIPCILQVGSDNPLRIPDRASFLARWFFWFCSHDRAAYFVTSTHSRWLAPSTHQELSSPLHVGDRRTYFLICSYSGPSLRAIPSTMRFIADSVMDMA